MTHALEPWGNAPGPVADAGADPVALEDRLADARSRRARVLAAREETPAPVLAGVRRPVPPARRRLRPALLVPAFGIGLAAGTAATLLVPALNGPPPAPPAAVLTAAALTPPPASLAAPEPPADLRAALPPLPALAPPAPDARPPRTAAPALPPRFALALGTAVPPGPASTSPAGFDPGHLAPSVRAAFPTRSSAPVALASLSTWAMGTPVRPVSARATASARNEAAAPPRNPLAALFRAIGRLANGGGQGHRR